MKNKKKWSFWDIVARLILRNRIIILLLIVGMTVFWSSQWKYMQFTFTEANLLPDNHPENVLYQKFLKTFGEDGNLIAIAIKDSTFFNSENLQLWKVLNEKI
ncbi:RND family transporter, partial [Flavobacteriaceae bacterium]|nr:RND family transporter [Flavobacteriaceae bacterium]